MDDEKVHSNSSGLLPKWTQNPFGGPRRVPGWSKGRPGFHFKWLLGAFFVCSLVGKQGTQYEHAFRVPGFVLFCTKEHVAIYEHRI